MALRFRFLFLLPALSIAACSSLPDEALIQPLEAREARAVLTSYHEPPEVCLPPSEKVVAASFQARTPSAPAEKSTVLAAPPREIRDLYPSFSGIAVDPVRNEVVVTDENLQQIMFYRRTENNGAKETAKPARVIGTGANSPADKRASKTNIEFQAGVYVEPRSGEVYGVNNDSHDSMVVFSRAASGNVAPDRELAIPHGAFGIAVDEGNQELFLTIQHDSAVTVFRKAASGDEAPLRLLQGGRTRLANPHGIALDPRSGLIFVTNQGAVSSRYPPEQGGGNRAANLPLLREAAVPGSGKMLPPAITVHSRTASGDTPPIRVIEGPRTRLNWPTTIAVDPERKELYVANDAGESILVFDATAEGNVEPRRVLAGPKTGVKNPTGLTLDLQNRELWVANFGNHTATVYPMAAQGDAAPLRTIRSAPLGTPSQMIGNPGGVAFDTRREEILVPN
jgi:DNA-binding beta-propeller fold protein YncE